MPLVEDLSHIELRILGAFFSGMRPDPVMTVREWADTYRYLPETSAMPGKFSTAVTPWVREPMERLSVSDPAQFIWVQKSSQSAFTETGNNWLGSVIDLTPDPFLYIMPTKELMIDTIKNRIEKMIEATPALTEKVAKKRSRDKSNTLLFKEFRGGILKGVGANSPVGLSSIAVRFVYMDELDRFPEDVGGEGDAMKLSETRTITFGNRRKVLGTSTPTIKGKSKIENKFQETGQRFFHVPCPFCDHYQPLFIDGLKMLRPGDYKSTVYECAGCGKGIEERYKKRMVDKGKWVAKYPEREDGITYGYFINIMYTPANWYSWGNLLKDRDSCENNIPEKKVFTNTKLGESFQIQEEEKVVWESLLERAEQFEEDRPFKSVAFITAGVDVQKDRLEVEIVGWMKGKRSQSIAYHVIIGDTSQKEVWDELTKIVNKTWVREDDAELPLRMMAVDTGYNTEKVYEFTQKHSISRVIPVKGDEKVKVFFTSPKVVDYVKAGKPVGKVKVWRIGVGMIKSEFYGFLKLSPNHETGEVPDGFCFFPKREPTYFKGLTAEELVQVTNKRNFEEYIWVKKYKRNEPLDTRVYARAAAAVVGMDRWTVDRWDREVDNYEKKKPAAEKKTKPKKKSDFW